MTADTVVIAPVAGVVRVLLIRRRSAPYANHWALPGGFLDMDETLDAAARRELREETGLVAKKAIALGFYDRVDRDPRGRTISAVFCAVHLGATSAVEAGDDAEALQWAALRRPPKMAFDHDRILRDARGRLRQLATDPKQFAQQLLPRRVPFDALFDLLHGLDRSVDRAALRRRARALDLLTP